MVDGNCLNFAVDVKEINQKIPVLLLQLHSEFRMLLVRVRVILKDAVGYLDTEVCQALADHVSGWLHGHFGDLAVSLEFDILIV